MHIGQLPYGADQPWGRIANIPAVQVAAGASIFGRDDEVSQLVSLFDDPAVRLVTITGRSGVGKSTVALQVGREVRGERTILVVVVELTAIASADLALPHIASALDVAQVPGTDPTDALVERINGLDRLVVVLDNFEHLVEAGRDLADVIARCPRLQVLVTSQVPLRLRIERTFSLDPLPVPPEDETDPRALVHQPAVAVYCARAEAVTRDFALDHSNAGAVAALCRDLEGLPLALELAAARAPTLPADEIRRRLENGRFDVLRGPQGDAPVRHHDLRSAIAWTYDLLAPGEQRLLRWISTCTGSFDLDAVAGIVPDVDLATVLDQLAALVDLHLVDPVRPSDIARFTIPSSIKEFADERLAQDGEHDAAHLAHVHMRALEAIALTDGMAASDEAIWFDRLLADQDDLLAALHAALDGGLTNDALVLADAMAALWESRGYHRAQEVLLDRVLELASATDDTSPAHAHVLVWSAELGLRLGSRSDRSVLLERIERGEALARAGQDDIGVLRALACWAMVAPFTGDLERAASALKEGLALSSEVGIGRWIGTFEVWSGMLENLEGRPAAAAELGRVALERARRIGDSHTLVAATLLLLPIGVAHPELDVGRPSAAEALVEARAAGLDFYEPLLVATLVADASRAADRSSMLHWALEALDVAARMPSSHLAVFIMMAVLPAVETTAGPEPAARFYGAHRDAVLEMAVTMADVHVREHERIVSGIRDRLGADQFEELAADGAARPRSEAIRDARAALDPHQHMARVDTGLGEVVPTEVVPSRLTDRQRDVLTLLARGLRNKEIASELGVSPKTVMHHTTAIYRALGVRGRAEAAAYAVRAGLAADLDDRGT